MIFYAGIGASGFNFTIKVFVEGLPPSNVVFNDPDCNHQRPEFRRVDKHDASVLLRMRRLETRFNDGKKRILKLRTRRVVSSHD